RAPACAPRRSSTTSGPPPPIPAPCPRHRSHRRPSSGRQRAEVLDPQRPLGPSSGDPNLPELVASGVDDPQRQLEASEVIGIEAHLPRSAGDGGNSGGALPWG